MHAAFVVDTIGHQEGAPYTEPDYSRRHLMVVLGGAGTIVFAQAFNASGVLGAVRPARGQLMGKGVIGVISREELDDILGSQPFGKINYGDGGGAHGGAGGHGGFAVGGGDDDGDDKMGKAVDGIGMSGQDTSELLDEAKKAAVVIQSTLRFF